MMIQFLLVACVLTLATVTGQDYCEPSLCHGHSGEHIACNNKGAWGSACPEDVELVDFNENLKYILLKAHNDKRNLIAGGGISLLNRACRMATMTWDDELAEMASLNVRNCVMNHDACHNTVAFRYSGQNLARIGYYEPLNVTNSLEQAVQLWFNEIADIEPSHIEAYPVNYKGPTIGHVTVLVADRNIRVGCSAVNFSVHGKFYRAFMMTCNYATTNMVAQPMYTSCSRAGSECTTGVNILYPNLCSTSEQYSVNTFFKKNQTVIN